MSNHCQIVIVEQHLPPLPLDAVRVISLLSCRLAAADAVGGQMHEHVIRGGPRGKVNVWDDKGVVLAVVTVVGYALQYATEGVQMASWVQTSTEKSCRARV